MALDFFAGCVGGCAGVIVGHPFDTIKVHLQTQDVKNPKYNGILHCVKTIIAAENVRGLYRGMASPLAGIAGVNAIVFGVYGNVQRFTSNPNTLSSHMVAGSAAGFLQSFICSPMELAKTRMQLQDEKSKGIRHKGSFDCLRYIFRTEGMKGTFRGFGSTVLRDIPGFAGYFVSYEFVIRLLNSKNSFDILLAGGVAGICSWIVSYPFDVVKTVLQVNSKSKYTGIIDCMQKQYQSNGIRFFFRGINVTLIRAFPTNAACFFIVSVVMRLADLDFVVRSAEPLPLKNVLQPENYLIKENKCKNKNRKLPPKTKTFDGSINHTDITKYKNVFISNNR